MKIRQVLRLRDDAGEFAERLRHEARLQAHRGVAHVAFEFGLGNERGDRVDDDHIDAAGADQRLRDFQGLLAVVGLRDQEIVHVHAELAGVDGIEGVLGVDEGGDAAQLLRFGDDVQGHGGLTAGFRAVDFDDAAARKSADAQSQIQREASGGNYADGHQHVAAAQAHDRAFAVVLFDLGYGRFQQFGFFIRHFHTSVEESRDFVPPGCGAPGKRNARPRSCYGLWSLPFGLLVRQSFLASVKAPASEGGRYNGLVAAARPALCARIPCWAQDDTFQVLSKRPRKTPVENREKENSTKANKRQILFFALCSLLCQGQRFTSHKGRSRGRICGLASRRLRIF